MLPLVEEVREARQLAEEAQRASLQLTRIAAALVSVAILLEQPNPSTDTEIPATDLIRELAESWPALSDLEAIGPRPSQEPRIQLFNRQTQLRSADSLLRPISEDGPRRGQVLHDLQHRQRHLLEDPVYAREVAEVGAIGAERDLVAQRLHPLKQRQILVDPAHKVVALLLLQLSERLEAPYNPTLAMQLPLSANAVLDGLRLLLGHLQLDLHIPENLPTDLDRHPGRDPRSATAGLLDELRVLQSSLETTHQSIQTQVEALELRHAELTSVILERLG